MLQYNADNPVELQAANWNCSCCTTAWALQSVGFAVTEAEITTAMVNAGLVNSALGLLDASGAALQDWMQDTFNVSVERLWPAGWEDLNAWVGKGPILLGGRAWCHWSACRGGDPYGLVLANPAPSWCNVGQHMDLAEWNTYGQWTAMWIDVSYGEAAPVTDAEREYVMSIADNEIRANIEKALQVPGIPPEAVEPLLHGALPAAQTLASGTF